MVFHEFVAMLVFALLDLVDLDLQPEGELALELA